MAVDAVANALIPPMCLDGSDRWRREELDEEYGCNVSTRVVRDVASGKVVVCVGVSITPRLLRHMQGDFR